jgi:hypothetical protein
MGIAGVGRKHLDVEVKVWLLGSYPPIVIDHSRLAMGNINPWIDATCSVLGIRTDDLEAVAIDAPGKGVPERVLDHARQTINGILGETSLIEDYPLPVMITS